MYCTKDIQESEKSKAKEEGKVKKIIFFFVAAKLLLDCVVATMRQREALPSAIVVLLLNNNIQVLFVVDDVERDTFTCFFFSEEGSISSMFLCKAFSRSDPESAKKLLDLTVFFALLGSA